jgi:hypothetical protein
MDTTTTAIVNHIPTVALTQSSPRGWRKRPRGLDHPWRESRVFPSFEGETIFAHLENRRSRPWQLLKPLVAAELTARGIAFTKLTWNRYAGCTMCPCSGGFVIEGGETGVDHWVTVS